MATPIAKRLLAAVSITIAIVALALTARHFASTGWPLAGADLRLVGVAGGFFLLTYAFKAYGWRWLFRPSERPQPMALAAAGGAASLTGAALPGRFDDVVRVAVVRRFPGSRAAVSTLCLSLFTLGLVDAAALMPFSAAAAATSSSLGARSVLAVVAFGGLGAGILLASMPRVVRRECIIRYRIGRWLASHFVLNAAAGRACVLVLGSWTVRAAGLFFLLAAFDMGVSFPLAVAFLSASAASAALPITPVGGAVTQAGAGAAILMAAGHPVGRAVAFAVAAQTLFMLAGAAILTFAAARQGTARVATLLAAAARV